MVEKCYYDHNICPIVLTLGGQKGCIRVKCPLYVLFSCRVEKHRGRCHWIRMRVSVQFNYPEELNQTPSSLYVTQAFINRQPIRHVTRPKMGLFWS